MKGCQGAAERRRDPLETPLLLFFILSGAGWLWEVAFVGLSTGALVNRGFLHGPWLPVYGVGGLLFLLLPRRMEGWTLAAACALAGGGLEYAVSLVLEALFHQRWWDYAGWPGSLNGRVCLVSAAAFGLAGWLLTGWAEPLLRRGLEELPPLWRRACCRGLCLLFAADAALSLLRPNSGAGISFPV